MPIILPLITVFERNVAVYSHSTVFAITHTAPLSTSEANFPSLLDQFSPPSSCRDRWMVRGEPYQVVVPTTTYNNMYDAYSVSTEGPGDRLYNECKPVNGIHVYSPGVCPDGQTLAEVTLHQMEVTIGVTDSYWQASCCPSGFTCGSAKHARCASFFTTPLTAFVLTAINPTATNSFYESIATSAARAPDGKLVYSTSTAAKTSILPYGYAIADPIIVAWQKEDLEKFQPAYASSVASQIRIQFPTATPGPSSTLPSPTPTSSHHTDMDTNQLSLGAKIGTIIGTIIAVSLLGLVIVYTLKRHRRRNGRRQAVEMSSEAPRSSFFGWNWWSGSHSKSSFVELDSKRERVELEAVSVRLEETSTRLRL
ncbi:hypothetical protein P280DRAFT_530846 [Massarina eburnea CBS 473.64]|uniref:Uncharacterized protein n=1 Tax=Massarina eburnea CBS 473.64 TaxID=1395130 RepID=A0A6A6RPJ6_9PLEO|nr:hypothetical protein P280DRAFT_530846 [Massarina eburnea CBS 473.64]